MKNIKQTSKNIYQKTWIKNFDMSFKNITRRERLKSALYLRLKNRETFFSLEFLIFFASLEKCHIVPKNVKKGTLFDL